MANTGDYGGQCVTYAKAQLNPNSKITGNANTWWGNSTYCTQLSGIQSKCAACWSGGSGDYGHVGVVESWDATSKTMTYSDSNYKNDKLVIVRKNLSESGMKKLFGSSYTFQGYVTLK